MKTFIPKELHDEFEFEFEFEFGRRTSVGILT
jgi:hypothetical protein